MEGNNRGLLHLYLHEGTEEYHEEYESEYPGSGPSFEIETTQTGNIIMSIRQ